MTKELEKKVYDFLEKTLDEGAKGYTMLKEKFPGVVEDYLTWAFWDSVGMALLLFMAAVLILGGAGALFAKAEEIPDEAWAMCAPLLAGVILICIWVSIMYSREALEIHMTPTTYLLEHVRSR